MGMEPARRPPPQLTGRPAIKSSSALIVDQYGNRLYAKNVGQARPIASVTKLMTAMVVLDSGVSLSTPIRIVEDDRDRMRNSSSRLRIGAARLSRGEMIMVALTSSDNRAAHALGRTTYRGGSADFVKAMNRKARSLGMSNTRFVDATGLDERNRSTAEDLAKMVRAASNYGFIRKTTELGQLTVRPYGDGTSLLYRNTNPLVRSEDWDVEVSKTGFINEAGRCLVMQTHIGDRDYRMVFLGASGKGTPVADSKRVKAWVMSGQQMASR